MPAENGLTTRLARDGDAEAIAEIYNQGIEERIATFETYLRTAADIRSALAERATRYPTVVAERGGRNRSDALEAPSLADAQDLLEPAEARGWHG